jgi:5-methylcytosine-specific restriction endonuclease McrA
MRSNGRKHERLVVDLLPSKSEIFEHWKDRLLEIGFFIDWGEPSCWACGFHYGAKYDVRCSTGPWAEVLRCWERVPLQRCHIVPRSLGGPDSPANLFLMCRECHDSQPNSSIPEIFFRWARNQSSYRRFAARCEDAVRSFCISDNDEKIRIGECMNSRAFKEWVRGRCGLHWPQSGYASIGHRVTVATLIGLAKCFIDRNLQ